MGINDNPTLPNPNIFLAFVNPVEIISNLIILLYCKEETQHDRQNLT